MNLNELLQEYYGITEPQLDFLEGFENKTYRVSHGKELFVLKLYVLTPEAEIAVKSEDRVLEKLGELKGYTFPKTVTTSDNKKYITIDGTLIRMLHFVDGSLLGDIKRSPMLLNSLGVFLGRMDAQLKDLNETELKGIEHEWDLRFFHKNLKYLPYIENAKERNLVRYFFLQYDEQVIPVADSLRKGLIHNDANDWNIVTVGDLISGIFDFGDLAHTWVISELAIGITYIMMNEEKPLECAVEVIKGYHQEYPLLAEELDILYYLVAARLCVSVLNSAYGKTVKPDSEYVTISEDNAWALLKKWKSINPINAKKHFREAAGFSWKADHSISQLQSKRDSYLSKALSLSYSNPIPMHSAAFQYMYDIEGNTYLDAYNNIMLTGHCHPHVVSAGQRMMARLNTNTRYLYSIIYEYCENLLQRFPDPLNKVFLVNSGSEASDLAIRIARSYTDRKKIMVLEHGYHGNTSTGIDISHYKYAKGKGLSRSENIVETPMPKAFGSGFKNDGEAGRHFSGLTASIIESHRYEIAAFIAEPVMGCGGQVPLAKSYLQEIYPLIREQGGLCISDEVQVGFGRLGSSFWGFEQHGVIPDMVVLGKPMGNGHPIGAVITTEDIAARFAKGPEFFSSFGGNPVSCAIGNAVLEVIDEEKLQEHALATGNHLMTLLEQLKTKFPVIADVRGHGMFIGVELVNPTNQSPETELSQWLKNKLKEHFILIGTDGPYENVLKIKPPLSFDINDSKQLAYELEAILGSKL